MPSALLQRGFRPFFLVAAAFAAAVVPFWTWQWTSGPQVGWSPLLWHGHEMIWGFALAVISGFLLTAVQNWTGRTTTTPPLLAALVSLWLAGRVAMVVDFGLAGTLVELAYLPALATTLAIPILRSGNRRNYKILAVLFLLHAFDIVIHATAFEALDYASGRRALLGGVDMVGGLIVLVTGRVVAMFTRNATSEPAANAAVLEKLAGALVVATVFTEVGFGAGSALGSLMLALGLVLAVRSLGWKPFATLTQPLLLILHLGHAWLALGFFLRGVALTFPGTLSPSLGLHALTVGGIGITCLAMMVRVSRGHTGRDFEVRWPMAVAFCAIVGAALARAIVPAVFPDLLLQSYWWATACWSAAFGAFVLVYGPILWRPRVDGRPG